MSDINCPVNDLFRFVNIDNFDRILPEPPLEVVGKSKQSERRLRRMTYER